MERERDEERQGREKSEAAETGDVDFCGAVDIKVLVVEGIELTHSLVFVLNAMECVRIQPKGEVFPCQLLLTKELKRLQENGIPDDFQQLRWCRDGQGNRGRRLCSHHGEERRKRKGGEGRREKGGENERKPNTREVIGSAKSRGDALNISDTFSTAALKFLVVLFDDGGGEEEEAD